MRRRRRAGGQTLVEFSLVLPIFMVVIFATIDFGGYFGARLSVENAARAGDRVAVVETQAGFSGASIVNAISAEAQDNGGLPMNADCFWNGTTLTPTTYPPFTFSGKGCIGVWYFQLEQVGSPQLCTQWSVANSAFGSYSGSTWTASTPAAGCFDAGGTVVVVGVGYQYAPLTPVPFIGALGTNCPSGGNNGALCTYGETQLLEEEQ